MAGRGGALLFGALLGTCCGFALADSTRRGTDVVYVDTSRRPTHYHTHDDVVHTHAQGVTRPPLLLTVPPGALRIDRRH